MARRRDDDDYDRPRRSRRDDEDYDRPRRSRRDDYDEEDDDDDRFRRRRPRRELGPLDAMFRDTHIIVLVLLGLFCSGIGLILAIIGVCTGKDPTGKSNAMIVLILSAMVVVFNVGIITLRILAMP